MGMLGSLRILIWRSRSSLKARYDRGICVRYNTLSFILLFFRSFMCLFQKDPPINRSTDCPLHFVEFQSWNFLDKIAEVDLVLAHYAISWELFLENSDLSTIWDACGLTQKRDLLPSLSSMITSQTTMLLLQVLISKRPRQLAPRSVRFFFLSFWTTLICSVY